MFIIPLCRFTNKSGSAEIRVVPIPPRCSCCVCVIPGVSDAARAEHARHSMTISLFQKAGTWEDSLPQRQNKPAALTGPPGCSARIPHNAVNFAPPAGTRHSTFSGRPRRTLGTWQEKECVRGEQATIPIEGGWIAGR